MLATYWRRDVDYANQVNNSLTFTGVSRGALDARAPDISQAMKRAAVELHENLHPAQYV